VIPKPEKKNMCRNSLTEPEKKIPKSKSHQNKNRTQKHNRS